MFEETLTNPILDFRDRVVELLGDSLALERVNGIRVGSSGHNDERDNGYFGPRLLQPEVQTYSDVNSEVEVDRCSTHEPAIQ